VSPGAVVRAVDAALGAALGPRPGLLGGNVDAGFRNVSQDVLPNLEFLGTEELEALFAETEETFRDVVQG
jgi:hypothetical protein